MTRDIELQTVRGIRPETHIHQTAFCRQTEFLLIPLRIFVTLFDLHRTQLAICHQGDNSGTLLTCEILLGGNHLQRVSTSGTRFLHHLQPGFRTRCLPGTAGMKQEHTHLIRNRIQFRRSVRVDPDTSYFILQTSRQRHHRRHKTSPECKLPLFHTDKLLIFRAMTLQK